MACSRCGEGFRLEFYVEGACPRGRRDSFKTDFGPDSTSATVARSRRSSWRARCTTCRRWSKRMCARSAWCSSQSVRQPLVDGRRLVDERLLSAYEQPPAIARHVGRPGARSPRTCLQHVLDAFEEDFSYGSLVWARTPAQTEPHIGRVSRSRGRQTALVDAEEARELVQDRDVDLLLKLGWVGTSLRGRSIDRDLRRT